MDFRPPVPGLMAIMLAKPEHAGQRGDPHALDVLAHEKPGFDRLVHLAGFGAGHADGAGNARTIEEGKDGEFIAGHGAGLEPKLSEVWKLLRRGKGGIDRDCARGKSILVEFARAAEIGPAEQRHPIGIGVLAILQSKA